MTEGMKLDPIISEFDTQEEADAYDRWFRETIQDAIDNPGRLIPHDEVMRRVSEIISDAEHRARATEARRATEGPDPIVSEFDKQAEADAYDRWFRAKVQASLNDPRPDVSHEEVVSRIDAILNRPKAIRRKA
jgi:hypothetical protein